MCHRLALGFLLSVLFVFLGITEKGALPSVHAQTGVGLEKQVRWISYNGQFDYLVGFDTQEFAMDTSITDYPAKLDLFKQYGVNKLRIWVYAWFQAPGVTPWARDAAGKHNLDVFDTTYWSRMRAFVQAAKDRDIIVEVTIFAPNNLDTAAEWSSTTLKSAENKAFNVNGAFTANASGHLIPEYFNLTLTQLSNTNKRLVDYQRALVNKTVDELGGFPNVYFEICNEFPVNGGASINTVYPWQRNWADEIRTRASTKLITAHAHQWTGTNTTGIDKFWDYPSVDILGFHFNNTNPATISGLLHSAQTHGKVLQSNEGGNPWPAPDPGSVGLDEATKGAWAFFTSGGYYAFYEDDSTRIGQPTWVAAAQRLGALRTIANKVRFWEMSPVDSTGAEYDLKVTAGPLPDRQVLANPGQEYVIYLYGSPATTTAVSLTTPTANVQYTYSWYNAANAALVTSGITTSGAGGVTSIAAPPAAGNYSAAGLALLVQRVGPTTSAKINFQLAGSPLVSGYDEDTGQVYGSRNGKTYGWNVSHTTETRDRNLIPNQLLDTLCHFKAGAKWELAVPAGQYSVTVSVGDAQFTTTNTINVEGVNFLAALPLGVNQFRQVTQTVTVTDGRLTIDNGTAAAQLTKINYVEVTPAAGLAAHWKFDETSGTVASDSSGNGRTGTLLGGPVFVPGNVGNALSFDGVNDYVSAPSMNLDNASAVTVAMRFKRAALGSKISLGQGAVNLRFNIEAISDRLYVEVENGAQAEGSFVINDTNWHRLTAVFDGSQPAANRVQVYLDGVVQTLTNLTGTFPTSLGDMENDFAIGRNSANGSQFTSGLIDEVKVYNRALSPAEAATQ